MLCSILFIPQYVKHQITSRWRLTSIFSLQIDYPLWLNADILPGPVNATTTPVDATQFLYLAKQFKNSTLSIGWTTSYGADFPPSSYTKEQIDEMLETIKTNSITQTVTFPVRAGIAAESLDNMKLLLQNVSDSTLTIWSSEGDNVNVTNLRNLIKSVGLDKVYVDVPADLQGQLHLDTLSSSSLSSFSFLSFVLFIFLFLTRILWNISFLFSEQMSIQKKYNQIITNKAFYLYTFPVKSRLR